MDNLALIEAFGDFKEIKNIDRQIVILKNQEINLLKAEIDYISKEKIKNIQEKIVLNTNSLNNYRFKDTKKSI